MPFDIEGARAAGASDDQIADYLAQSRGFDIESARKAGASNEAIIGHLSSATSPGATGEEAFKGALNSATGNVVPNVSEGLTSLKENVGQSAEDSGRQALRGVGKALPVIAGLAAGPAAARMSTLAGTGLSSLAGGAGEAAHQFGQHATSDPEAPQTSGEAFDRILVEGGIQGGLHGVTATGSKFLGKMLGSEGTAAARETVKQAERSGVNPNTFSYGEASDEPSMAESLRRWLNRSSSGYGRETKRLRTSREAIDAAEKVQKPSVKKPFDDAVEGAFQQGKKFDTSSIADSAKAVRERLLKEEVELEPDTKRLLDRLEKFKAEVPTARVGSVRIGLPVKPGAKTGVDATSYKVRGLYTELSDMLNEGKTSSQARRVAKDMMESVRGVDDEILPQGTRERYHQFMEDFGEKSEAGSLRHKLDKEPHLPYEGGKGLSTFFAIPKNTAAWAAHKAGEGMSLEAKISFLEKLKSGKTGLKGAQGLRAADLLRIADEYGGNVTDALDGPYDKPDSQ